VSEVTTHGFSLTPHCVTRLGLALSAMTARGGGLNVYAGIGHFPPTPLLSRRLAIPPVRLSEVSQSPSGIFWCFPCVSEVFVTFPALVVVFCLSSVRPVTPKVAWLSIALACPSSLVSSPRWGYRLPQYVLEFVFLETVSRRPACSSKTCLTASLTVLSHPSSSCIWVAVSFTPFAYALPASLLMWSWGSAG
jgi:hypothetical protein